MIQTKDKTALVDYLVSMELLNPALRGKFIESPYGPFGIRQDTENGFRSMQLFIEQGEPLGNYKLTGYTARIVDFPPYTHLSSQHMSTAELEERMAAVDWNKESYKILNHLPNPVDTLFNDALLLRLVGSQPAKDIVDILLLKYCAMTPAMNLLFHDPYDHPFVRTMEVPLNQEIRDLTLPQAWNLLGGRAVMKFNVPADLQSAAWYRLNGTSLDEFPNFDMPGILSAIPISGNPSYEKRAPIYLQLVHGYPVSVNIKQAKGKAMPVALEVDPVNQCVIGKDPAGNLLQFKTVDPDIQKKREAFSNTLPPAKKKVKRKGRSL